MNPQPLDPKAYALTTELYEDNCAVYYIDDDNVFSEKIHIINHSYFIFIVVSVIVYGAAGVGFAFMAQNLGGTVLQVRTLVIG